MGETEEVQRREVLMRLERPLRWAFVGMALVLTAFFTYLFVLFTTGSNWPRESTGVVIFFTGIVLAWRAFDSNYHRRNWVGSGVVLITLTMLVVTVRAKVEHIAVIAGTPWLILGASISLGAWLALTTVSVDAAYARRMWAGWSVLMIAATLGAFAVTAGFLRAEIGLVMTTLAFSGASLFTLGMRHMSRRMRLGPAERWWTWCTWINGVAAFVFLAPFAISFATGEPVREMFRSDDSVVVLVIGTWALVQVACISLTFAARWTVDAIDRV